MDDLADYHDSFYWANQLKRAEEGKPHDPKCLLMGLGMLVASGILHIAAHIVFVWLYGVGIATVLGGSFYLFRPGADPAPIRAKYEAALRREQAAKADPER